MRVRPFTILPVLIAAVIVNVGVVCVAVYRTVQLPEVAHPTADVGSDIWLRYAEDDGRPMLPGTRRSGACLTRPRSDDPIDSTR